MIIPEYGPLSTGQEFESPKHLSTTDLGAGNLGSISAGDLTPAQLQELILDAASEQYNLPATNRFRCVDGCLPDAGLEVLPGYADPGMAGGIHISDTAGELLSGIDLETPISERIAENTHFLTKNGLIVVTHGDDHTEEGGCGANKELKNSMGYLSDENNGKIVGSVVGIVANGLGLSDHLKGDDFEKMRKNAYLAFSNEKIWDTTPEENVSISVENGAEYERLIRPHNEKLALVSLGPTAFNQQDYSRDHPLDSGLSAQAFSESLGVYARWRMENSHIYGDTKMRDTALGILAVVTFNVVIPKLLTAENKGNGEALPVVVMGNS